MGMTERFTPRRVPKPWGSELIWADHPLYGKWAVRAGRRRAVRRRLRENDFVTEAVLEGFRFLGIEKDGESVQIARARINYWESNKDNSDVEESNE